jgi:hypothetical protein
VVAAFPLSQPHQRACAVWNDWEQRRPFNNVTRHATDPTLEDRYERHGPLCSLVFDPREDDEIVRRLEDAGDWPPDGLDVHVLFGSEGDLRVSELWDSREQLEAFGERLRPVLAEVGIDGGGPELMEVHNIVRG